MLPAGVGLAELRVGRQYGTGARGSGSEAGDWEGELMEMADWGMFDNLQSPTLTSSLQPPMTVSHKICSLLPKIMDMQRWSSLSRL